MSGLPTPPVAGRLLGSLPAVYRQADRGAGRGDLGALLAAFEAVLLGAARGEALGYEQRIAALPSLLSRDPLPERFDEDTRAAFAPWLAAHWVAFAPFAVFDAARLRRIVGGIVPLYGRRGTPGYLRALLHLCFEEELASDGIALREHLGGGFVLGESRLGVDTWIGDERPHVFELRLGLRPHPSGWNDAALAELRRRLQAVIDFAKPAHTVCELRLHTDS